MLELNILARTMLASDLAEFMGIPRSEVPKLIYQGYQSTIDAEKDWKGSREDFYKSRNDWFLFNLAELNIQAEYWNSRLAPLAGLKDINILDFGCGIGTTALFLMISRNRVYGYDINERMLEFAEFRKKKFGFSNITFSSELPDLFQFDVILAIDVLEHVEDLQGLLLLLGRGMKWGAKLYHYDSFNDVHPHPLHYDRPKDIDGWLEDAGLVAWNERWAIKHA